MRYRSWFMLIGAAVVTAAVGWYTHERTRDQLEARLTSELVSARDHGASELRQRLLRAGGKPGAAAALGDPLPGFGDGGRLVVLEHPRQPPTAVDTDGYASGDRQVVGAWTWLDDLGAGVAAELDRDRALAPLITVSEGFWILFGLFAAVGVGVLAGRYIRRIMRPEPYIPGESHQLGQYTLEEKLGEGAMGTVYRARHALLRRPTAVKLLRSERARDSRALRRFEREVQLTSRLMHPNTVAVYDFGHTSDGIFYYAMEFIEGITLEQLVLRNGPLAAPRAIYVLKQVCGSLAEAHELGLIHRDIKPANIMLCEQGGEHDVVKVLDFGLVKEVGDASSSLTLGDALAGTPLYASPEAIRSTEQVEPRSDLYSLGAVAYFLVTGERLFDGETVMEVCTKHLSEEPMRPSLRLGEEIPADLEAIILACLAKDIAERPASARVLRDQLVECEDHPRWGQHEAREWWRDHRDDLPLPGTIARRQLEQAFLTLTVDMTARGD